MKSFIVIISLLLAAGLFATKPLPPGSGVNVKPNVLFIIDDSGSMSATVPGTGLSRIQHTKNALLLLLNQTNLTTSIRMGLSVFPRGGCSSGLSSYNQVRSAVKENDDAHLTDMRNIVTNMTIPNCTPIGESLRGAGWYFKGQGAANNVCYGSVNCNSPIIDRCQKNYVVLFTDGEQNGQITAQSQAAALNTTGFLGTVNGFSMTNSKIQTYAIGFAGVSVDYIAVPGGTTQGYQANNQAQLLTAFTAIINDISAKSITSSTPTVIPNFVGDEGVLYQAQFKPRQDKQWEGHFYKYSLGSNGLVSGLPSWDVNQLMPLSNERNIYTVCRKKDNTQLVTAFTPENAETLNDCMVVNGQIGAGNPVEICSTTNFNWLGDNVVNWKPPRVPVTYQCLSNFRSQIQANLTGYEYLCYMSGFSNYSGGTCSGQSAENKAKLIERYLCQYNHTCDCYSDWLGLSGKTKACGADNQCNGSNNPAQPLSSCKEGYCVGSPIYQNDPAVWLTIDEGKYQHNLNTSTTFGDSAIGTGFIELSLKDLIFADGSGGGTYKDYFSIRTVNPQNYFIIVSEQNGADGVIYDCGPNAPVGHGAIIQMVGCTALSEGDNTTNIGTVTLTRNGNDAVLALPASSVSVLFKSDNSLNDIALIVQKWRNKRAPEITCHWEQGGAGTPLASVIDDTKKLINFFRGKDAYGEDSTLTDPLGCSKDRTLLVPTVCKERLYKLADIFNSRAKFFGKPHQSYVYADYKTFQTNKATRAGNELLLIGSNGGMLHAIDIGNRVGAVPGKEMWAYLPPNLLPYLKKILTNDPNKTNSAMFVDRSPKIMDIYNPTATAAIPAGWRSIVLVTFGEGGYGLMALDITDVDSGSLPKFLWAVYNESPLIPTSALFLSIGAAGGSDPNFRNARRVLKWDHNGGIVAYWKGVKVISTDVAVTTPNDYTDLAETWSEPVFGQGLSRGTDPTSEVKGNPVAVFGSGGLSEAIPAIGGLTYGSVVYVINPLNGIITKLFKLPASANNVAIKTPANIAVLPRYKSSGVDNRIIDLMYVTDIAGRLWKMNPNDLTAETTCTLTNVSANANSAPCKLIFNGNATLTNKDFMYYGSAITFDKQPSEKEASLWAYMGTGNSDIYDITNNEGVNYLYAVRDYTWSDGNWRDSNNQASTVVYPLAKGNLTQVTSTFTPNSAQCNSSVSNGWYFPLGQGTDSMGRSMVGEKLVGEPTIIEGYVYFVTYVHGTSSGGDCGGALGVSYVYSFELFTGCFNPAFKEDLNGADTTAQARAILGRGVATSPVMRGKSMYFGISGEGDANETPIFGDAARQGNLIKWDRGTPATTKSSDVPFSFFREIF